MISLPHDSARRPRGVLIPEGTPFGRLTVESGPFMRFPRSCTAYFFRCVCQCGKVKDFRASNLLSGNTTSCGCGKREKQTTHGESGTRLHNIRSMILQRCYNPKYTQYEDYGGRGIKVCPEWRESYEVFRDWALANGYRDDLTIERNSNDKGYCPENCTWETRATQARNKRNNRIFTAYGETKCLADWATDARSKVTQQALNQRLKLGWDFERALTEPSALRRRWKRRILN